MVNKEGQRELAYVVQIADVHPIEGSDNCECAVVNGWNVMVRKGTFQAGDKAVYFEVDSKVDTTRPEFAFLAKYNGKVKTQRYTFGGKGNFISQGLIMPLTNFGFDAEVGEFFTAKLGVTYYDPEDNIRKDVGVSAYDKMLQRNAKFFNKKFFKWLMQFSWGRKICFFLFKNRGVRKTGFPTKFPYVKVTDEERIENTPTYLNDRGSWVVTEKLDGTSSTYILERKGKKFEFYVLSRRVRQLTPNQKCYHENNIYWEMAEKYQIEKHLKNYLRERPELSYVALQGESVGNVQGNPLKLKENDLYIYNFITSDIGRWETAEAYEMIHCWGMKWVPIIAVNRKLPHTMEEMKNQADGRSEINPRVKREGLVYRKYNSKTLKTTSFKNVSNEYLLSKHD